MRLSLRTLLAFEDKIFDIEQQRHLERTISNNETAMQTISRIRNAVRDPYLNAPGIVDRQEELDPNIVAEYLDHQMSSEYLDQFENFCFSNDKYLAEVASVHQVISTVLGEPARTNRECRFRCYDLFPSDRKEDWNDLQDSNEEEQSILKLKSESRSEKQAFHRDDEHEKTYRFNVVTGEQELFEDKTSAGTNQQPESSVRLENNTDAKQKQKTFLVAGLLLAILLCFIVLLVLIARQRTLGAGKSAIIPADVQISSAAQNIPAPIHSVQTAELLTKPLVSPQPITVVLPPDHKAAGSSSVKEALNANLEATPKPVHPTQAPPIKQAETLPDIAQQHDNDQRNGPSSNHPAVSPTQSLSGYGISDPFAAAMNMETQTKADTLTNATEKKKPIQDANSQIEKEEGKLSETTLPQQRIEPLEPLRRPKQENSTVEGAFHQPAEKNNPLRNESMASSQNRTNPFPVESKDAPAITPVAAVSLQDSSVETSAKNSAFAAPDLPASHAELGLDDQETPKKSSFGKKRSDDEANANFPSDMPVEAKVSFHDPAAKDVDQLLVQSATQSLGLSPLLLQSGNDASENGNENRKTLEWYQPGDRMNIAGKTASMSKTPPVMREARNETSTDRIIRNPAFNAVANTMADFSTHSDQNPVATASLLESQGHHSELPNHPPKHETADFGRERSRGPVQPILPVSGITEQKEPVSSQGIQPAKTQLQPQKPEPINRVLGTVRPSSDANILFSATSANAPWKLEQGPLDLFAEQYLLTATPFRTEIELGEDFRIEMIGDSKLCIMPTDEKGTPGIFLDYGRLVIRTKNNITTNGSARIKSLRIRTERSEGIVTISGPKSLVFIDTFAEVVESATAEKSATENETVQQTAPILGLLPDPTESVSWTFSGRSIPYVANRDTSFLLDEGRYDHGAIKHHPNWIRRISLPPEGREIELACRRIFKENNENCEAALHVMIRDHSLAVRSFGLRLWGDLGRFDVPLSVLDETKEKNEPINGILTGYFRDVMKRDEESVQRLADAIQAVRRY